MVSTTFPVTVWPKTTVGVRATFQVLVNLCGTVCEPNGRAISVLAISPKAEVVSSIVTVPIRHIHCTEVELEIVLDRIVLDRDVRGSARFHN